MADEQCVPTDEVNKVTLKRKKAAHCAAFSNMAGGMG